MQGQMLLCSYRSIHRRRSRQASCPAFFSGKHLFAADTVLPGRPRGGVRDSYGAGRAGAAARTLPAHDGNRGPPAFAPVAASTSGPISLSRCSRGTQQARVLIAWTCAVSSHFSCRTCCYIAYATGYSCVGTSGTGSVLLLELEIHYYLPPRQG